MAASPVRSVSSAPGTPGSPAESEAAPLRSFALVRVQENKATGTRSYVFTDEAKRALSEIRAPLRVIAIVGAYRLGKSYLMSQVAGAANVFKLDNGHEGFTRGIWGAIGWQGDQPFLYIDSEGLGDATVGGGTADNDANVFVLTCLMASTILYNLTRNINESDVTNLNFIAEIARRIQVSPEAQTSVDATRKLRCILPELIWVIRDCQVKGTTPDALLHSKILSFNPDSQDVKDLTRKALVDFFGATAGGSDRRPMSLRMLPHPNTDPEDLHLRALGDLGKFGQAVSEFVDVLRKNTQVKVAPDSAGKPYGVTGPAFISLVTSYVDAINSGRVPVVSTALEQYMEQECREAVEEGIAEYDRLITQDIRPQIPIDDLSALDALGFQDSQTAFTARAAGPKAEEYRAQMIRTLERMKLGIETENLDASTALCDQNRNLALGVLRQRLDSYETVEAFTADREAVRIEYNNKVRGPARGKFENEAWKLAISSMMDAIGQRLQVALEQKRVLEAKRARDEAERAKEQAIRDAEAELEREKDEHLKVLEVKKAAYEHSIKERDNQVALLEEQKRDQAQQIAILEKQGKEVDALKAAQAAGQAKIKELEEARARDSAKHEELIRKMAEQERHQQLMQYREPMMMPGFGGGFGGGFEGAGYGGGFGGDPFMGGHGGHSSGGSGGRSHRSAYSGGRQLHTGSRGGQYYLSPSGNKQYVGNKAYNKRK